jgi:hypothetical protein
MFFHPLVCFALIPIIIAIFGYSRLTVPSKWVFCYVLFSFVTEVVAGWWAHYIGINHLWYLLFVVLSPLMLFFAYYRMNIRGSFRFETMTFILLYCFISFNSLFIQNDGQFPTYSIQASSLYFISLSLSWYMKLLANPPTAKLFQLSGFWFNTGSLFYHILLFFHWIILIARIQNLINDQISYYWTYAVTILFWMFIAISFVADILYGRKKPGFSR